jgi:hypothetical protein
MKTLLCFLIPVCVLIADVQAQAFTTVLRCSSAVAAKHDVALSNRAYTSSTNDTTYAVDIRKYSSVNLTLQTTDSATILIKYRLSLDGTNWTTLTTIDSLVQSADGVAIKNYTASTVALGCSYVQFALAFSALSRPAGTTTPAYWATVKTIQ